MLKFRNHYVVYVCICWGCVLKRYILKVHGQLDMCKEYSCILVAWLIFSKLYVYIWHRNITQEKEIKHIKLSLLLNVVFS